jgi:hypothetical protein
MINESSRYAQLWINESVKNVPHASKEDAGILDEKNFFIEESFG